MTETDVKTTDVATYSPKSPVGTKRTLMSLLEQQKGALREVLPRHVTPERLMKTLLLAVNRQPQLLQCTQESVLEAVGRAAELGLDVSGTLGEAYLVPFKNKIKVGDQEKWIDQATFIPGYRGLAKLARQSGEVSRIEANVVYERDTFELEEGVNFKLKYKRSLEDDRGKKLGAYALVQLKDDAFQFDWMTTAEIEKIRNASKSGKSPAWTHHWDGMAKKTVFRRLSKWLPLSGEKWERAIEVSDSDYNINLDTPVIDVTPALPEEIEGEVEMVLNAAQISDIHKLTKALSNEQYEDFMASCLGDEWTGDIKTVKAEFYGLLMKSAEKIGVKK